MLTEVDVQNPDGILRAGLYPNVTIDVPRQHSGVIVPDEALVFNAKGLQVAVVDGDTVHYRNVSIYRDFGTSVELRDGLDGTETLVLIPPPNLEEGGKVRSLNQRQTATASPANAPGPLFRRAMPLWTAANRGAGRCTE